MSFTHRELYMLLGGVVVLALVAAILAPRELKEATASSAAASEPTAQAGALPPAARVSPNGRYSTATWAPAPKPRADDPTPY